MLHTEQKRAHTRIAKKYKQEQQTRTKKSRENSNIKKIKRVQYYLPFD